MRHEAFSIDIIQYGITSFKKKTVILVLTVQCVPFYTIIYQSLITSLCQYITFTLVSAEDIRYNIYCTIIYQLLSSLCKTNCHLPSSRIFRYSVYLFILNIYQLFYLSLCKNVTYLSFYTEFFRRNFYYSYFGL